MYSVGVRTTRKITIETFQEWHLEKMLRFLRIRRKDDVETNKKAMLKLLNTPQSEMNVVFLIENKLNEIIGYIETVVLDEEMRKAKVIIFIPDKHKIDNDMEFIMETFTEMCEFCSMFMVIQFAELVAFSNDGNRYLRTDATIKMSEEICLNVKKEEKPKEIKEEIIFD